MVSCIGYYNKEQCFHTETCKMSVIHQINLWNTIYVYINIENHFPLLYVKYAFILLLNYDHAHWCEAKKKPIKMYEMIKKQ